MRYHVKERSLSLKDDFVVRDENGKVVYKINGKLIRIWDSFSLRDDETGEEVLHVKQKVFANTRQYEIYSGNNTELATLRRKEEPGPHGERFEITTRDGMTLQIIGDFHEWDFKIIDHYGRLLGNISREWSFPLMGDHYTVDVAPGVDGPFIVVLTALLDEIREDFGKE
jgi:uncharacterized protein YxjI